MMTSNSTDQRVWKRYLQDALLELDAQALREKLKAAHKAIEIRRVELTVPPQLEMEKAFVR
jgi:hypothetical protein